MSFDELVKEGRRLAKPCVFLMAGGDGPIGGWWHSQASCEKDGEEFELWITVDTAVIPNFNAATDGKFMRILIGDSENRIEFTDMMPSADAMPLYLHHAEVLPPLEAVFLLGSDSVGAWLEANGWDRETEWNPNFADSEPAKEYIDLWMSEYPAYQSGSSTYAMLGGWHFPCGYDWLEFIDDQLLMFTVQDANPFIEAWHLTDGSFLAVTRSP
jgi:hypothetical protein